MIFFISLDPIGNFADTAELMTSYTGGKNTSGVYQKLICQIPPHKVYVEGFLGSGAILRMKRPAEYNFGVEVDANVINQFFPGEKQNQFGQLMNDSFFEFINWFEKYFRKGKIKNSEIFFFLDPPYLGSTRSSSQRQLYRCDMMSEPEHINLLETIKDRPYKFMICGYESKLYNKILKGWRKLKYMDMTRGGRKESCIWMNYPEPLELHDYSFLGENYRERQDIKRQIERWENKFKNMPLIKRFAMLAALENSKSSVAPIGGNAVPRDTAEMPMGDREM